MDARVPDPPSVPDGHKRRILGASAACTAPGEIGALLRREGLYSSHLAAWRRAEAPGTLTGPPARRGPQSAPVSRKDLEALQRRLARAERAEALIELQKKVAMLFGESLSATDEQP